MSSARDRIIARLLGNRPDARVSPLEHGHATEEWPLEKRISRFVERMQAVRTEVLQVRRDGWVERLLQLCEEKGWRNLLYGSQGPLGREITNILETRSDIPELIAYEQEIEQWKEALFREIDAAITSVRAGIATTGTLVIWPTPQEPRTLSLVPPVHIAVLDADRLYTSFEEVVRKEAWQQGMPSNALLISGPSKTADIEQTLSYGIHGPTEVIVFLLS